MAEGLFDSIDWQRPWLKPLRPLAEKLLASSNWRAALNDAAATIDLKNHRGLRLQFVPQADLPPGIAYERFISDTGGIPTRDNLHDFFNALIWLSYPGIKVRLNALQAAEIERRAALAQAVRGRVRDAATIFDENAALVLTSDPGLVAAIREHYWQELFVERRKAFHDCIEVRLFGHALMEKLVAPYKAITAHAWLLQVDPSILSLPEAEKRIYLDTEVAVQLQEGLDTSAFTPLPVLGIPGWQEGQDSDFYADNKVFRAKRQRQG